MQEKQRRHFCTLERRKKFEIQTKAHRFGDYEEYNV